MAWRKKGQPGCPCCDCCADCLTHVMDFTSGAWEQVHGSWIFDGVLARRVRTNDASAIAKYLAFEPGSVQIAHVLLLMLGPNYTSRLLLGYLDDSNHQYIEYVWFDDLGAHIRIGEVIGGSDTVIREICVQYDPDNPPNNRFPAAITAVLFEDALWVNIGLENGEGERGWAREPITTTGGTWVAAGTGVGPGGGAEGGGLLGFAIGSPGEPGQLGVFTTCCDLICSHCIAGTLPYELEIEFDGVRNGTGSGADDFNSTRFVLQLQILIDPVDDDVCDGETVASDDCSYKLDTGLPSGIAAMYVNFECVGAEGERTWQPRLFILTTTQNEVNLTPATPYGPVQTGECCRRNCMATLSHAVAESAPIAEYDFSDATLSIFPVGF